MTAAVRYYESSDGATSIRWKVPEWTPRERWLCRLGMHEKTRRVAVHGFIKHFTRIGHYYCACRRKRWMWFDDGWLPPTDQDPDEMQEYLDVLRDDFGPGKYDVEVPR